MVTIEMRDEMLTRSFSGEYGGPAVRHPIQDLVGEAMRRYINEVSLRQLHKYYGKNVDEASLWSCAASAARVLAPEQYVPMLAEAEKCVNTANSVARYIDEPKVSHAIDILRQVLPAARDALEDSGVTLEDLCRYAAGKNWDI